MLPLPASLRLGKVRLWGIALTAVALLLCVIPLFNHLGYAFCLVMAWAVSFAGAHLGAVIVADLRRQTQATAAPQAGPMIAARLVGRAAGVTLSLLVLPLLVITANIWRVGSCDYLAGLAFFVAMPGLSAVLAATTGVCWALLLRRGALATVAASATVLGFLCATLYQMYSTPAVFAYDPFFGYFPGPLYDELVTLSPPFFWARALHFSWAATLLLALAQWLDGRTLRLSRRAAGRSARHLLLNLTLLATALLLTVLRPTLGVSFSARDIEAHLGGLHQTPHIDIFYPRELDAEKVARLAEDHDFRFAQLAASLGTTPRQRLRSYVFRSAEEKRRLIGAAQTQVAKPWRGEIYLQREPFPHRILKHELAHLFLAPHGDRWFGLSISWRTAFFGLRYPLPNMGLVEGAAVALDWPPHGEQDGHEAAAALLRIGKAPDIETLFGLGFYAGASRRTYVLAGSFCRYLLSHHGIDALLTAYRTGGQWDVALGQRGDDVLDAWLRWLSEHTVTSPVLARAEETFHRTAIFQRPCAHDIARRHAYAKRAAQSGDYRRAAAAHGALFARNPAEPRHLLAQAEALVLARAFPAALDVTRHALRQPGLTSPLTHRLHVLAGDLHIRAGYLTAARQAYAHASTLATDPAPRRALTLRRWALGQAAEQRTLVFAYLLDDAAPPRSPARALQHAHLIQAALDRADVASGLGQYLVGRQLAHQGACDLALAPLAQAIEAGLPHADFRREALTTLGRCAYRSAAWTEAEVAFAALHADPDATSGDHLRAKDWLSRIALAKTRVAR